MADVPQENANLAVVDASALVSALRHDGVARKQLLTRSLFAPHLIDQEVAQVLRRCTLAGGMEAREGQVLLRALAALGLTRYPAFALSDRIWELRDHLTANDAAYVAVAEALDCTLITADTRIAAAPGVRCVVEVVPN